MTAGAFSGVVFFIVICGVAVVVMVGFVHHEGGVSQQQLGGLSQKGRSAAKIEVLEILATDGSSVARESALTQIGIVDGVGTPRHTVLGEEVGKNCSSVWFEMRGWAILETEAVLSGQLFGCLQVRLPKAFSCIN